jgi:hypothetical protein
MQTRSNTLLGLVVRLTCVCSIFLGLNFSRGQDYLTPGDVKLSTEAASQEALDESAAKASLRFLGLDLFPRGAVNVMYDDNILISGQNPLSDVEWTILPGLTATAGDLSLYLPGPVTLSEIRGLLTYSLLDDSSRPQRFLGVDYSPAVNFFTENSEYNGVDQIAGLSAGYTFSRLAIGLDQDYFSGNVKNNGVGDLIAESVFNTRLRLRYGLTDRSDVEVNGQYHSLSYEDTRYEGYQEFRNEDWYNRTLGARLQVGLGAAFGFVNPEGSPNQTYEQALVQALYVVGGKLDLRGTVGLEFRQYDSGQDGTLNPVFSLSATYQPRVSTTFTVEAHRQEEPSFAGDYNYITLGFSVGARQLVLGRLTAALAAGYDNTDYVQLNSTISNNRADNYYLVRASLQYDLNRHVGTTLFWIYRQDASNVDRYSYTDNMVGVRVNWYY